LLVLQGLYEIDAEVYSLSLEIEEVEASTAYYGTWFARKVD
jgi:hypothetical protein